MGRESARSVKWVEGLRGIASVLVIVTHLARAFDYRLFWPKDNADTTPRLLQYPIIRVPWQGRIGVPIFAFLTGFVCALKPLKLSQAGNPYAAYEAIAKSAFRRPPRLILPATIALLISWTFTVFGGYRAASRCDSYWVRFDSPIQEETLWLEFVRLFDTIRSTWTTNENIYDRHQWAMLRLLVGAFHVYITLAATMAMRLRYRIAVYVGMILYWWQDASQMTETFGVQLYFGMLISDLSQQSAIQTFISSHRRALNYLAAPILITCGLYFASYPQEHQEWEPWSEYLQSLTPYFIPERVHLGEHGRRFTAIGTDLCIVGVFLSPAARLALEHRWLMWLGRHSFAVYLIHGTILRTLGVWIVYGISGEPWHQAVEGEKQYWLQKRGGAPVVWVSMVTFVTLTYAGAWLWMRYVDEACARATQWLEAKVFASED
ncbi:uncharacterized protein BDZ99DRAFT_406765, partial [Mytilinidion resinicola]